jgi:peroxiredoxin Q/BCP
LRQHDDEFRKRGSAIVAIAPDGPRSLARFWEQEGMPFPAVADPEHRIAELLGQEVQLLKLGRMPAVLVVDPDGIVRAAWYGESMRDIPSIEEVLAVLDSLGASV